MAEKVHSIFSRRESSSFSIDTFLLAVLEMLPRYEVLLATIFLPLLLSDLCYLIQRAILPVIKQFCLILLV